MDLAVSHCLDRQATSSGRCPLFLLYIYINAEIEGFHAKKKEVYNLFTNFFYKILTADFRGGLPSISNKIKCERERLFWKG